MSRRLQLLRRLREARTRMRDIAAAQTAEALRAQSERQAARAESESELTRSIDGAGAALGRARSISELEAVAMEIEDARARTRSASRAEAEAAKQVAGAREALLLRERALRQSERLIDREAGALARKLGRDEQRVADDLSAASSVSKSGRNG